jgi:hypothetical protein
VPDDRRFAYLVVPMTADPEAYRRVWREVAETALRHLDHPLPPLVTQHAMLRATSQALRRVAHNDVPAAPVVRAGPRLRLAGN